MNDPGSRTRFSIVVLANEVFGQTESHRNHQANGKRWKNIVWAKLLVCLLGFDSPNSKTQALQVQDNIKIELSGFSLSEAFSIEDGLPFELEQTRMIKLVYRLWQISLGNLQKYSQYTQDVGWEKILADPPGYRLQVFETKGRAKAVQKIPLPDASEELQFVYRVSCVSEDGQPFEVLSLLAPRLWLGVEGLDQPMASFGFFYAMIPVSSKSDEQKMVPLFLAKQIQWYPNTPNEKLGITEDQVLLAKQNVDIASLEIVGQEDRKPLGSKDARPFYQFLEAVGKIEIPADLPSIDHMEVLRKPKQSFGRRVTFRARVKKCSVVHPPVDQRRPTLSIDQYYQLMVFPDLRDARDEPTMVEIGRGDEKLAYRRFPFTICCRQLPAGMSPESIENQQVWIDGYYFRFWQYDAERTRNAGVAPQISPIIIANRPSLVESTEGDLRRFFNSLLLILIAVLAIVGFTIFRIARRNRSTKMPLPERLDIDKLAEM